MNKFPEFADEDEVFWLRARFIAEQLGYATRKTRTNESRVKSYSSRDVLQLFDDFGYRITRREAERQSEYSKARADAAESVKQYLMDANQARRAYEQVIQYACKRGITWEEMGIEEPWNKQKGEKAAPAFLTAMVDILTCDVLREYGYSADYDPRSMLRFLNNGNELVDVSSRRLDGAVPSVENPFVVWEIKEYYYTTTFGSRIADGVYETRLDGFEIDRLMERTGFSPVHVLFTDSYSVWWDQGKSYLCRLIDMLNEGAVDLVYFGKEVFDWPQALQQIIDERLP